jgi:capsular polysaccharide biosynthesis protein
MTTRQTVRERIASRWWLIVVVMLVGAGAGYAYSTLGDPVYEATTTLLIGQPLSDASINQETLDSGQRLATTYADLVARQPVLDGAAIDLGLQVPWEELRDRVHASVPNSEIPIVAIRAEASSPAAATALAGAVGDQVIALSPTGSEDVKAAKVQSFVQRRVDQTQALIADSVAALTRLNAQADTASGRSQEALRRRAAEEQRHLLELQQNYTTLLEFLSTHGITNYVSVLEQPVAGTEPVAGDVVIDTAIGALLGLLLGVVLAYLFGRSSGDARRGQQGATASPTRAPYRREAERSGSSSVRTTGSTWSAI